MSFFIYPHKFDACHVHFGPATQNQTTENPDNKFYRMIYSTNHISLNSMGFFVHFIPTKTAHSPYTPKWFMSYDVDHPANAGIIAQLRRIECSIIDKFTHSVSVLGESHQCVYSIAEHVNSGCIKAYAHHHHHADDDHSHSSEHGFAMDDEMSDACDPCGNSGGGGSGSGGGFQLILNIFGVWETRTQCGVVYKFTKW